VTGAVLVTGDYTLASPASLTATELYFNLTGKTTGLPSTQFQFQASSSGGTIPIKIQTGTVKPSYALNLLNYTYSATTGNVTAYTQLPTETVTLDFTQLGPASPAPSISIYESTIIISAVSWSEPNRRLTITTTGTGTMKLANPTPYAIESVTMDGVAADASHYAYDATLNIATLTGSTAWVIQYTKETSGPGAVVTTSYLTTTNQYGQTTIIAIVTTGVNTITIPITPPSWWDFGWINPSNWPTTIGNNSTGFGSQFYTMNPYFELTTLGWVTVMISAIVIMGISYVVLARTNRSRRYT
jgi:hypothetical protein